MKCTCGLLQSFFIAMIFFKRYFLIHALLLLWKEMHRFILFAFESSKRKREMKYMCVFLYCALFVI